MGFLMLPFNYDTLHQLFRHTHISVRKRSKGQICHPLRKADDVTSRHVPPQTASPAPWCCGTPLSTQKAPVPARLQ